MASVTDIIGGSITEGVAKIISLFKVDPNLALQHQTELEKIRLEMERAAQDATTREIEAASANIRAEAGSGDQYTSRARPSFIYVMLVILVCNYIIFPWTGRPLIEFPEALFWLFGSCMLGYTGARTWEKYTENKTKK
jgi:hypothetical protein